jgi:hypothetical protein
VINRGLKKIPVQRAGYAHLAIKHVLWLLFVVRVSITVYSFGSCNDALNRHLLGQPNPFSFAVRAALLASVMVVRGLHKHAVIRAPDFNGGFIPLKHHLTVIISVFVHRPKS